MAKNPNTKDQSQMYDVMYAQSMFGSLYRPDDLMTVKGPGIYKKMMLDEQVKVVVQFRKNSIVARDWFFYFDNDVDLPDTEKDFRIKLFTQIIKELKGSFQERLKGIMSSLEYGFSLTEKVYKPIDFEGRPYWGLKSLRTKPFDTFDFIVDEYGELLSIEQRMGSQIKKLSPDIFIHHVHNTNFHEYYGQSELREVYRSYFAKDIIIKLENIRIERLTGGFIWLGKDADAPPLNTAQANELKEILRNINTKTGLVLPSGYNLNLENPSATAEFDAAKRWHDRAIAKGLLMPQLMGFSDQGNVGSNAQASTQQESFVWMLDAEAQQLAETLNEQLFSDIAKYNFDDGIAPTFEFKELSNSTRNAVLEMWSNLLQRGAVTKSQTDEAYIREQLGMPEIDEEALEDAQETPEPEETEQDEEQDDTVDNEQDTDEETEDDDATVMGKGIIDVDYERFSKAVGRVNFTAIKEETEVIENKAVLELQVPITDATNYLISQISEQDLLNIANVDRLTKLKIPNKINTALKKKAKKMMAEAWKLGVANARNEMNAQKKFNREEFHQFTSIGANAAAYFESRGFTLSGSITRELNAVFNNTVLMAIKKGINEREAVLNFMDALAERGMVDPDHYEELFQVALDTANPQARLRTLVRTHSFEAINESRFNFFTDPELGGFVRALEYSAILDSRVTEICRHMDSRIYLATSEVWDQYRPPNHYNCRSILIAVTALDDFEVTEDLPQIEPQSGFG